MLGCVGGIVAVGLGLVLAYRLLVEIYDRREYSRFEKEQLQLNWKQVRRPPPIPLGGSLPCCFPTPYLALTLLLGSRKIQALKD